MSDTIYTNPITNKSFKNLIPPLSHYEFNQLEKELLRNGCNDPICVWNDIIIDGYNQYEICIFHGISFKIKNFHFENENEVIIWICENQIRKRKFNDAARRYMIGKKYDTEKMYTKRIVEKISKEYGMSSSNVYKYGMFSRAIDILDTKNEEFVFKILYGHAIIPFDDVIKISRLPDEKINFINNQIKCENKDFSGVADNRNNRIIMKSNIKDMPKFDPDSEISSLALTIPSWINLIDRTFTITDFKLISDDAKYKLLTALGNLKEVTDTMFNIVKE